MICTNMTSSTRQHLVAQMCNVSCFIGAIWTISFQLMWGKQIIVSLPQILTSELTEVLLWKAYPDSGTWLFFTFWQPFLFTFLLVNSYWSSCTLVYGASLYRKAYLTFQNEWTPPSVCLPSTPCWPLMALTVLQSQTHLLPSCMDTEFRRDTWHITWFMKLSGRYEFSKKDKVKSTCVFLPNPNRGVRVQVLCLKLSDVGSHPHCDYVIGSQCWDGTSHHHLRHQPFHDLLPPSDTMYSWV